MLLQDLKQVQSRARSSDRPFVTLAYAQSVDGSIALARGRRCTLSGPESLGLTHTLRACHDAILVGVGTVLTDDPELSVRLVEGRDPQPVIVDSRLSTPPGARLLGQAGRQPWIGTTVETAIETTTDTRDTRDTRDGNAIDRMERPTTGPTRGPSTSPNRERAERRARLETAGCRILPCTALANGWVDLDVLLRRLRAEGIEQVMVEGGARIITSFLDAQLVDYVFVTIAPVFLGGLSAVGSLALSRPSPEIHSLKNWISGRLGDDLVLAGETSWSGR